MLNLQNILEIERFLFSRSQICRMDEFKCFTGECIAQNKRCNRVADCQQVIILQYLCSNFINTSIIEILKLVKICCDVGLNANHYLLVL